MYKKDVFEKNKNHLVKKAAICTITILFIAVAFFPTASSCHTPGIKITKTGPIFAYAGDEITYNYNVSNTGDVPLKNVTVSDDQCGTAGYISGDENKDGKLDTDEIWMFTCTYIPSFVFTDPLVNTAIAYGEWENKTVEDIDDYTLYPLILRKKVLLYWENSTKNEENINYNDPETQFTIKMSKDGEVLDTFTISESSMKRLWLNEGTFQFCEIDLPDGYESAYDCISFTTGENYPDWTNINLITFDLAIEKSGPEYGCPGDDITYYYYVTNDGPASVTPVVEDDICGTPVFTGGDTNDDGLIDPGEIWTYECNYTVVEEIGSFIYNTVNVTDEEGAGRPLEHWWLGGDRNPSDNVDVWSVEVFCEPEEPENGDEYTLTINVIGNGSVAKNPDQPTYTYENSVGLEVFADPYWTFDHWSGDLTGNTNPDTIIMDDNKEVTAHFTEDEEPEPEEPKVITTKRSGRSHSTNLLPVANANGPYDGLIDKEIKFDGSKSYDPDGIITNYSWSFGDGTTRFGENVTHKYTYGQYFVVELTVIDNFGARDTNKTAVFIRVPNRLPSIPMISGPTNGNKDTKYSYAFGSTDPDNDDINYIINWGDGSTNESGFLPSGHFFSMLHSWAESGEYNITVTASDDQSSSASSEMTVHIEENILVDNIAIVLLGILALIALMIALMYNKKRQKEEVKKP
jgi:chitodextrinase